MDRNEWLPRLHAPHPKQRQFLLLSDVPEVLYGGAAGGGKSSALLMAAAQYADVPGYAALLLRRSYPDLMQPDALIPRSKDWWSGKAHWSAVEKRWTFPSGATVTFGYLERDDDVYQYQGAAYQFVGIDETTQHTEFRYRYLFSRLRRPEAGPLSQVPLRMRSASNPGGKGHEWVKKRFILGGSDAVFVPARLEDNPTLDAAAYERSLSHLDPMTRAQLLRGDWDAYVGGRFKREWLKYYRTEKYNYRLDGGECASETTLRSRFLTVDTAATVKEVAKDDPDYTVISAWALTPKGGLVWLGCDRLRCEIPDIPDRVATSYARFQAGKVVIEGGGTQKGVPQLCRRHQLAPGRHMNVVEVVPKGDKLERAAAALNLAEAGRLFLPAARPGFPLEDVEAELLRFTGDPKQDAHDDIVDTLSMAAHVVQGQDDLRADDFTPYPIPVFGRR